MRYLFITASIALLAVLTKVVVTLPEARLQVTREELLIMSLEKQEDVQHFFHQDNVSVAATGAGRKE